MVEADVESRMDALRKRLLNAVKVEGIITYKQLSLALNQNETFVQQFVTKRSPKRLFDNQVEIIEKMIAEASVGDRAPQQASSSLSGELGDLFNRLLAYPSKVHDRVISFAEYQMALYDQSREKDKKPASKSK